MTSRRPLRHGADQVFRFVGSVSGSDEVVEDLHHRGGGLDMREVSDEATVVAASGGDGRLIICSAGDGPGRLSRHCRSTSCPRVVNIVR